MKKVMLVAGLLTILGLTTLLPLANASVAVGNANTATATATAKADIVRGLTIAKTQDLNFGQIVPNRGGVITVSTEGSRTSTDPAMLIPETYDAPLAAAFDVTGDGAHAFQIILPEATKITNGKDSMVVDRFVSSLGSESKLSGELNETGKQDFTVGANLKVDANQSAGAYAGTFEVTVTYQ